MPLTPSLNDLDTTMNDADSIYEEPARSFGELGVPGPLVRLLAADGKKTAFPIQQDTLPDSLAGRDVLGRGQTGSGKTLAFGLPLVSRLSDMDRADDHDFPVTWIRRHCVNRCGSSAASRSTCRIRAVWCWRRPVSSPIRSVTCSPPRRCLRHGRHHGIRRCQVRATVPGPRRWRRHRRRLPGAP